MILKEIIYFFRILGVSVAQGFIDVTPRNVSRL